MTMDENKTFKAPEEMTTEELAKVVKPKDVLSEFFRRKRLNRIQGEFLRQLCVTYLREPDETDEYGSYKVGVFTYEQFVVEVGQIGEDRLWRLHVTGENPVPEHKIWQIRDRFIPDRCNMMRFYDSRENRLDSCEVILMEFPNLEEDESEESC